MPLCLSTEEHIADLLIETTISTVGLVQDFLPLLRISKGRIVNVWSDDASLARGCEPSKTPFPLPPPLKTTRTQALTYLRSFVFSNSGPGWNARACRSGLPSIDKDARSRTIAI
jgi:hypothetical protein